jgi:hypothetical protein
MRFLLLCLACLAATPLSAQTVTLAPPDPARWDISAGAGTFSGRRTGINDWDTWYTTGAARIDVGFYWTPHLRTEATVLRSGEGHLFSQTPVVVPGQAFPSFQYATHRMQTTQVSAAVTYQFLENAWVHPFLSAGTLLSVDRDRVEAAPTRPGPAALPVLTETQTSAVHPFIAAGAKFYVSPRAFIRSDLRVSLGTGGRSQVSVGAGIGVDF